MTNLTNRLILLILFTLTTTFVFAQRGGDPFATDNAQLISDEGQEDRTRDADFDDFLRTTFHFNIPIITCKELAILKEEKSRYFVLDARSESEYNMSHIEGAKRIGWTDFSVERVWMIDRKAPVIVYCSIGERSVRMAEYLEKIGFKDVRILYGSITEWSNQGNSLVNNKEKETKKILFPNKTYAKWLKRGQSVIERS